MQTGNPLDFYNDYRKEGGEGTEMLLAVNMQDTTERKEREAEEEADNEDEEGTDEDSSGEDEEVEKVDEFKQIEWFRRSSKGKLPRRQSKAKGQVQGQSSITNNANTNGT
jgi:hypothetical protein